ncbi:MAG: glycosyltransferase family 39 protein [Candidatus Magnetomorum sp.]|nr:glycosyltransferase family 39 protein [Candidatus Magnetomorum sp.]
MIESILNFCPPVTRDELIHHLAIPKIWLTQWSFSPLPWSDFSYYPMNIQLLYSACLWFGSDILPKYIHMLFGIGCSLLIYGFIKHRLGVLWALLGGAMFFSLPIVVWLATSAYVDLGLTFCTTASILYFIQYRWEESKPFKPLIFSAIFLGLAMGIKYNALIVFFFLNMAGLYMAAKSGKDYQQSLKQGLIFLTIACAVASPWYIRNFLYTGNPFYPLFNSLFQWMADIPVHPLFCKDLTPEFSMNAITLRKLLFNESIWETLLIPIRMFFQGSDDQYQYFQGILNPMMLVFIPFVCIPSCRQSWVVFILSFIFFYGYIAFFTTMHQVRYLLPIFPLMCILSVFGLHACIQTLTAKKYVSQIMQWAIPIIMTGLFFLNIQYVYHHFQKIDPMPYIYGQENRVQYLKKHLSYYEAFEYINLNLPKDSRILTFFLGRRGYYLDRTYVHEPLFGLNVLQCMVKNCYSKESFNHYLDQIDITHLLVRTDIAERHLSERYSPEERQLLNKRIQSRFKLIYFVKGYALWQIEP